MQLPAQSVAQQTLSMQRPEPHSRASPQASPSVFWRGQIWEAQ